MKSKKNWYTLLEIMIVLGVIIAIMGFTMRFSSSQIDELQAQTNKDELKNKYEELLLSNMSSNYYNGLRYTKLNILFQSGNHWFSYTLGNEEWIHSSHVWFTENKQTITKITANQEQIKELSIKLTPYSIGCTISNQTQNYSEAIIETQSKYRKYCFKITSSLCKGEFIPCL